MAHAEKVTPLTDAEVFGLSDEEVFGADKKPEPTPSTKVDMAGVMSAIATLTREMQSSGAQDRAMILAEVSRLHTQSTKAALKAVSEAGEREVKVEVNSAPSAAKGGWHIKIERKDGVMVGMILTPLGATEDADPDSPKNSVDAARLAVRNR